LDGVQRVAGVVADDARDTSNRARSILDRVADSITVTVTTAGPLPPTLVERVRTVVDDAVARADVLAVAVIHRGRTQRARATAAVCHATGVGRRRLVLSGSLYGGV